MTSSACSEFRKDSSGSPATSAAKAILERSLPTERVFRSADSPLDFERLSKAREGLRGIAAHDGDGGDVAEQLCLERPASADAIDEDVRVARPLIGFGKSSRVFPRPPRPTSSTRGPPPRRRVLAAPPESPREASPSLPNISPRSLVHSRARAAHRPRAAQTEPSWHPVRSPRRALPPRRACPTR